MKKRPFNLTKTGQRAIQDAVKEAGRYETHGWAHPTVIAMRLGVSRTTAVKWCKHQAEYGMLESAIKYGWRYSKSVRSIRFRVPEKP